MKQYEVIARHSTLMERIMVAILLKSKFPLPTPKANNNWLKNIKPENITAPNLLPKILSIKIPAIIDRNTFGRLK